MAGPTRETLKKISTMMKSSQATRNEKRTLTHDEIAQRARELYERSGCPSGRDLEFWLEAERQLRKSSRV